MAHPELPEIVSREEWPTAREEPLAKEEAVARALNHDFEATVEQDGSLAERPGASCFLRDGDRVFHTYSLFEREVDRLGPTAGFLDLTALGPRAARGSATTMSTSSDT